MFVAKGSVWIVVAFVITTVILNLASPPCLYTRPAQRREK